ncbi:MCE family protein [Marmoricola sp. RAF53]|uniref:MCE family protein n=1 Tax=Marmoricola sp. RAF53 TaxID=3233059 RepID=UPI003F96430B
MSTPESTRTRVLDRLSGRTLAVVVALLLVGATLLVFTRGSDTRSLTAHFSRAVAIYPGSEVRLMGVRIGSVDSVVPEGESVRVEMTYDATYKLPAGAKAAIITPTLVADRYVQITPAWTKGAVMADGADIALAKTAAPVELDRIYKSLADLSTALGPNGANKNGALSSVLSAGANALRGQGALANQTLLNMSRAVETFGDNSGPLFSSVRQLSQLTEVLAANDAFVNQFMGDLAGVSAQLAGERTDLRTALAALAGVVTDVRTFVHDNKSALTSNIQDLSSVLGVLAQEKESLGTALQLGPLGLSNLTLAYDVKTGSIGSRLQFGPTAQSLGNVLCDVVVNARIANAGLACQVLRAITAPLSGGTNIGAGTPGSAAKLGANRPQIGFGSLLGGVAR